ncbi:MAG: TetR/AcrR family transcriptional regulator [Clostridiales bacterium]|nr:TetR/AcrR family transcriptional regulator [Clostridiales bacterium]
MTKREQTKEKRMNLIVDSAKATFEAKGIEPCKMTDIADLAGVGVASLYRYFKTKADIAIEVGILYWHAAREKALNAIDNQKKGLENIENMFLIYLESTKESEVFFRFVEQFDYFITKLDKKPLKMNDYEQAVVQLMPIYEEYIIKGQADHSIRLDIDIETTLTMMNHTLMALKQKHYSRGIIITTDSKETQEKELKLLIDIFLGFLRN